MTIVLWILGVGAVIGVIFAIVNRESVFSGAAAGALVAGNCLFQLLVPAVVLVVGYWLLKQIMGW
jgi:hypothetical protein